jgi:hypothetical protein
MRVFRAIGRALEWWLRINWDLVHSVAEPGDVWRMWRHRKTGRYRYTTAKR